MEEPRLVPLVLWLEPLGELRLVPPAGAGSEWGSGLEPWDPPARQCRCTRALAEIWRRPKDPG